jgi:hypothetical protein
MVALQEQILLLLAGASYAFTSAIVLTLKIVQRVMLTVLRVMGPLMIGLSSLPGPMSGLAAGWCLTILEVGSWGLVGNIFLSMMNDGWSHHAASGGVSSGRLFEDIAFNIVYAFSFLLIPVMSTMIMRGGSAAGFAGAVTGFVTGKAAAAGSAVRTGHGFGSGGGGHGSAQHAGIAGSPGSDGAPTSATSSGAGDWGGGLGGASAIPSWEPSPRAANIIRQRSIEKQRRDDGEV